MIYIPRDDFSFSIMSKGVNYHLKLNEWPSVHRMRLRTSEADASKVKCCVQKFRCLTIKSSFRNKINAHNGFCCAIYDE